MNLFSLFDSLDYQIEGDTKDKEIKSLVCHSKDAAKGSLFFALEGRDTDGKLYISEACANGCDAVVAEDTADLTLKSISDDLQRQGINKKITLIRTKNIRMVMAKVAAVFYGNPSEQLITIGITGTKGKTSTAYMIWRILNDAGIKAGIIGTIFAGYEGNLEENPNTTPQSVDMQRMMRQMADNGCKAVVTEVSSQGLMQCRTAFVRFDIGVFTNLSPDHIGFGEHSSYKEYRYWKSTLFCQCKAGLINRDDAESQIMAEASTAEKLLFYGKDKKSDFIIDDVDLWSEKGALGVKYALEAPKFYDGRRKVLVDMPGEFSAYNSAAALAVACMMDIPWDQAAETLRGIKIPGRAQTVSVRGEYAIMADYAHNGKALRSLLSGLRQYDPARLIAVFGCGGNRAGSRRTEMGKAASDLADVIIVTSDNPRNENPMAIISDITKNISPGKEVMIIPDRREAIHRAMDMGKKGDIIVVAGKGHETYQILGNEIRHFDDVEEIMSYGGK